jgi:hypothetical protein
MGGLADFGSQVPDSFGITAHLIICSSLLHPHFWILTRTTMSDDGDRTCPLCAEEMDITDLQLKPCKCGYDVITYPPHMLFLH